MNIHLLSLALLVISAAGFHIPDLNLKSEISLDSSSTNTGLIHSSIRQNWSQSLNIGSLSIAATLVILFVILVMYLRTSERINDLVKNEREHCSSIRQNWSQSLNIGSMSIAATLMILICESCDVPLNLRMINDLVKNVQAIREEVRNFSKRNGCKPKQSSPNDTQL